MIFLQEWEEKLTRSEELTKVFKKKYITLQNSSGSAFMEEARNVSESLSRRQEEEKTPGLASFSSQQSRQHPRGAESIASLSSMAQHARLLVGQFNCTGLNERNMGPVVDESEGREEKSQRQAPEWRDRRSNEAAKKAFAARNNNANGSYPTRIVDV